MIYLGIDPGFTGALAAIIPEGDSGWKFRIIRCPTIVSGRKKEIDEPKFLGWLQDLIQETAIPGKTGPDTMRISAVIEKAQYMPKQGGVSAFRYGMSYGMARMALAALKIPYTLVHPTTWKRRMLRDVGKDKGASILAAKRLFPDVNLVPEGGRVENDGFAEALLMAAYARLEWGREG